MRQGGQRPRRHCWVAVVAPPCRCCVSKWRVNREFIGKKSPKHRHRSGPRSSHRCSSEWHWTAKAFASALTCAVNVWNCRRLTCCHWYAWKKCETASYDLTISNSYLLLYIYLQFCIAAVVVVVVGFATLQFYMQANGNCAKFMNTVWLAGEITKMAIKNFNVLKQCCIIPKFSSHVMSGKIVK